MSHDAAPQVRFQLPQFPNFGNYNGDVNRWATELSARLEEARRALEETPIIPYSSTEETGTLALTGTLQSAVSVLRAISGHALLLFSGILQIAQDGAAARSVFARVRRGSTILISEREILTIPIGASTLFNTVQLAYFDETVEGGYTYDVFLKITGGAGAANLLRRTLFTLEPRE